MPEAAPQSAAPWTHLFVGREHELARLRSLLLSCAPSLESPPVGRAARPALVVLLGDSGQGKSRLVQEFYRRIACAPSQGGLDPDDYWPDAFADPEHCSKVVNPDMPVGHTAGKVPPFIWWGVRWQEPAVGGAPSQVQLTTPAYLDQLDVHREGCKRRVEKLLRLAGRGLKLASSSLVPGLPDLPFVELVRQAIDKGSASIDLAKSARGVGEAVRNWREGHDAARGVARRRNSALGRVRTVLTGIVKPPALGPIRDAATPVILWLDDAQWMTPEECVCVHDLLRDAAARGLPLFVIATHWESEWRRAQAEAARQGEGAGNGVSSLFQLCGLLGGDRGTADEGSSARIEMLRLAGSGDSQLDLAQCLQVALPGLSPSQRLRVLELAGGNPLLLRLIVEELQRHPERFKSRATSGSLTAEAEADLAEIAASEARATFIGRRIRDLDVGVRRVLEMGSLQGSEFLREVTCEAAVERGIARDEAVDALRHASRLHAILDEGERTMSFRQDIYRDVLQDALGDAERRAIESAIRTVLVRRLAGADDTESVERTILNELAARFLAVKSGQIDWNARESVLWIQALLQRLESLDRLGLDVLALAKAREIVSIDARSPDGIPLPLLGSERAAFVLRVLARFGTDTESLGFGERLLARVRVDAASVADAAALELVVQVAELRGAIAQRALYVASLRGAQAALSEGDPLAARLALDAAPEHMRGPEHGMLAGVAGRKGMLLRGSVGGNPYRLRDLPGSGHLAALFDGDLEVVPRVPGKAVRFALKCLAEGCPAMRLATAVAAQPNAFLLAIGSTAYPGSGGRPAVHVHALTHQDGVWDLQHRWSLPSGFWGDATFLSSDSLAMPTDHGTIAVVDVADGRVISEVPLPEGVGPGTAIMSIDDSRVVVAVGAEIMEVDLARGTFGERMHAHASRVNALGVSLDGRQLCVGGGRQAVIIDRITGATCACIGIQGDVWDVAFSPDNRTLAVLGGDCMVRTFDARTGAQRRTLGEASGITWSAVWDAQGLVFSAEGGEVISLDQEHVEAITAETDRLVIDVDATLDRRLVLLAGDDRVHLTEVASAAPVALGPVVEGAAFHLVPQARGDGAVAYRLWNDRLEAFGAAGELVGATTLPLDPGGHVAVAPGGNVMLALRGMRAIRVSDVGRALRGEAAAEVRQFEVPGVVSDWFSCLVRDRSGVPMLGRMDGSMYDWSEEEPRLVVRVDGWMQAAAQLADGGWVCGNHNGRVQRVIDGVVVWCTDLRRAYVRSIACCERHARCYVLMANGPLHVLDLDSGERLCVLGRVEGPPLRLALGRDGQRIEAISADGTTRSWEARISEV